VSNIAGAASNPLMQFFQMLMQGQGSDPKNNPLMQLLQLISGAGQGKSQEQNPLLQLLGGQNSGPSSPPPNLLGNPTGGGISKDPIMQNPLEPFQPIGPQGPNPYQPGTATDWIKNITGPAPYAGGS
jgi:hypothetical protein